MTGIGCDNFNLLPDVNAFGRQTFFKRSTIMRLPAKAPIHFNATSAITNVRSLQQRAAAISLPPETVWSLVLQFGAQAVPIIGDVVDAFAGGFDWSKLTAVLTQDGPLVVALAQQIAAALGVTLPEMPAVDSK